MARTRPRPRIGDCLVELTGRLPEAAVHDLVPDGAPHPSEAAVDTPFLRRLRAVLGAIDTDGALRADEACRVLADAAPMTHHRVGPSRLHEIDLLAAAAGRDLLRCILLDPDDPRAGADRGRIDRGAAAHLVAGHPLVALVDPWIDLMLHDRVAALDCDPRLAGTWQAVPALLVQLLTYAGTVDLTEIARGLREEAGALVRDTRLPWPVPHAVLGLALGTCVEFGMARWDGDLDDLGSATITPLGMLSEIALRADIDGELPSSLRAAYADALPSHTWN